MMKVLNLVDIFNVYVCRWGWGDSCVGLKNSYVGRPNNLIHKYEHDTRICVWVWKLRVSCLFMSTRI